MRLVRRQRVPLGAAGDRPRDVQARRGLGAAGQDEAGQLRERLVQLVAEPLELVDHRLRDAEPLVGAGERDGQVGADVEQLVLDPRERRAQRLGRRSREHDPELRVELVDGAVRGDARIELRHARAVAEARLPLVAAARVDLRQADGLVATARAHAP